MADETHTSDPTSNSGSQTPPSVRGRPFEPGNSFGQGRKEGSRNKATLLLDALADGETETILRKVIDKAKEGDQRAQEIILSRTWPIRKSRKVTFTLPPMDKPADLVAGIQAVLDATADGELTPDEASILSGIIEAKRKAIETVEIEQRLSRLEAVQEAARK